MLSASTPIVGGRHRETPPSLLHVSMSTLHRLPQFLDWLSVRGLRIGESTLDLMFRRHDSSVAVNLVKREGDAEVDVLL